MRECHCPLASLRQHSSLCPIRERRRLAIGQSVIAFLFGIADWGLEFVSIQAPYTILKETGVF